MVSRKKNVILYFHQFRIYIRRLVNRCPRFFKIAGGPLLGGIIGLAGGIPGLLIGLLMGYLLKELFGQFSSVRKILDYLKNPGSQKFYEAEPGLTAYCALAILVAVKSNHDNEIIIHKKIIYAASDIFITPAIHPSLIEHFSRLALSNLDSLNIDLLSESLVFRRNFQEKKPSASDDLRSGNQKSRGFGSICMSLLNLAEGEKAYALAREICSVLDPFTEYGETEYRKAGSSEIPSDNQSDFPLHNPSAKIQPNPWEILGLSPETPLKEIKAHYRRLAKQFHPDELYCLDDEHRETAAKAFISIREAYKKVTGK